MDYIFIANDKNPNTYVISSAAAAYSSATSVPTTNTASTTGYHDATSSRIINAISGTAALTAATVTATTAIFGSINNSNNFASDSLITAAAASSSIMSSSSSLSVSPSTLSLTASSDNSMFSNVAVDLGSLLINNDNDSLLNDTSLLADLANITDPFGNGSASGNMTTPEDLGELIRMAATSVVLGLMILITIIGK